MPTLNSEIETQPGMVEKLRAENEELRLRLQEAEETIAAIRSGAVDAFVVEEPAGHRVYTLESADRPYRLFVEEMQQGAATLHADGTIAWCNRQLADLLKMPHEKLIGAALHDFVSPDSCVVYQNLLWQGQTRSGRGEMHLLRQDGASVSAFLTVNVLPKDCGSAMGVLVTDLTTQRHHEQLTAAHTALHESERRLREMIDALPVAIYTTDAEGRLTHFNSAAVELSGRTPELGTDQWCVSFKLYYPDGRPMPHDECPMAIALKEGRVIRGLDAIIERPDGTRVWFAPYPTLLRDRAGKIVGGINMLLDTTERKQAEEARARLAAIVDSSDDAIVSKTLEGVVTSWNAAAERLLGYRREEIIGRPIVTIIPRDHLDEEKEILEHLHRDERIQHFETVRMAKNGRRIEVSLSISPIRDGTGRVIGASKIMHDITERRQAEEALRLAQAQLADRAHQLEQAVAQRTAELRSSNEQLESFVYSMAHDLRAPLRSMEGFSALLLEEAGAVLSETGRDFANRINHSARVMDKLLLDLLDYGRASRAEIELRPVAVRKAWEDALFQTANEAEQANARIETVGPLPVVRAHEATLGQCLANLLSNALKFVEPGVQPHIRFRAEEIAPSATGDGAKVRLWVEDNGIGIAPEHQERAFRVFERLNGTRYPGTGIGLSIVRKGIERIGGEVGLESEPGKGSRFWIDLTKAE
jgi:PAS domain S-box-containing protein